jgi:hypothetical protein
MAKCIKKFRPIIFMAVRGQTKKTALPPLAGAVDACGRMRIACNRIATEWHPWHRFCAGPASGSVGGGFSRGRRMSESAVYSRDYLRSGTAALAMRRGR